MRFKIGDRVRIKSIDWYNENKDKDGNIPLIEKTYSRYNFIEIMRELCGKVMTISSVSRCYYDMVEDNGEYFWTDEMIEGLVEEKTKPKMVNLDDVCEWIEKHIFDFPWYDNEQSDFSSKDVANALRKAMEE